MNTIGHRLRAFAAGALVALTLPGVVRASSGVPPAIDVRVDPRVELLSIVFRLAGSPEYSMPNSISPYSKEVETWFGPFRAHPAVLAARDLRAERGVSYDAVMSFAVHLTDGVALGERAPFDPQPKRLDARWTPAVARDFLAKLRSFAADSKFADFLAKRREYHARAAERLAKAVADGARLDWFDSFFGAKPGAAYVVGVGLLNGGANYGVGVVHPDGREEITPVIGVSSFDAEGLPVFGAEVLPLLAHELCHSYTNPMVDAHAALLDPIAQRLFDLDPEKMKLQAYGTPRIVMYETFVRACVVRWRSGLDGEEGVKKEIEEQRLRGFEWVGDLAKMLEEFERDRKAYPTFESFVPRIAEGFAALERAVAERAARAPKIVEIVPRPGAIDVDAGAVTEIRVTFDRPMRDKSWSICGVPDFMPPASGPPSYDAERRVFRVPVKLEPGRAYRFSLNDVRFQGFAAEDGTPLKPVPLTFSTRR